MSGASASASASVNQLQSPFLRGTSVNKHLYSSSPFISYYSSSRNGSSPPSYPSIRAVDLDQNTLVAISVGVVSVAVGIGVPIFYESQIDNASKRENTQPCFPCTGTGAQKCRFCMGAGIITVELGGDEKEESKCINCDGAGSLTCTTCQGSGIQPRYLDRSIEEFTADLCWGMKAPNCHKDASEDDHPWNQYVINLEFKDDD